MDVFHVVIDTSMLRRAHFRTANFERLLRRSKMGAIRLYIPYIALEEERTHLLEQHDQHVQLIRDRFDKLHRGSLGMVIEGLPPPVLELWPKDEVDRNSQVVFSRFLDENKIEVIPISAEQAADAWKSYFDASPPFDPKVARSTRRKDIPDSWILVAAKELKAKPGRHCALVADNRLTDAFEAAGFETYDDVETFDAVVEAATSVLRAKPAPSQAPIQLDQLRGPMFKDIDVIVLGVNEALNTPAKDDLFSALERAGVDRTIAEHEAKTLVLSGTLTDTGSHFIPTNQSLARQAMGTDVVTELLLKII